MTILKDAQTPFTFLESLEWDRALRQVGSSIKTRRIQGKQHIQIGTFKVLILPYYWQLLTN